MHNTTNHKSVWSFDLLTFSFQRPRIKKNYTTHKVPSYCYIPLSNIFLFIYFFYLRFCWVIETIHLFMNLWPCISSNVRKPISKNEMHNTIRCFTNQLKILTDSCFNRLVESPEYNYIAEQIDSVFFISFCISFFYNTKSKLIYFQLILY